MIHEVLPVGPLRCNCSILGDKASREAIVVDPGDDIERILAILHRHQLTVKQILVTHAHIDHIAGAIRLKRLTGAAILYNHRDLPLVKMMDMQAAWLGVPTPEVAPPDQELTEGDVIAIGTTSPVSTADASSTAPQTTTGLRGHIFHTPGHTEGSVCLYLPDQQLLLAGDTLFAGSVGRTDLPGGNTGTLLRSIHGKLLTLPEETTVVPGHGALTTIGQEKATNPFLT